METLKDEEKALFIMSTPFPLTNLMVNKPCWVIIIGFLVMVAISAFTFYMEWLTPNNPSDRDFMVWGDPYVTNFDKSLQVSRELLEQTSETREAGIEVPLQSQIDPDWTVLLVYSSPADPDANIWTKEVLIAIRDFEASVQDSDEFKQTCLLDQETKKCDSVAGFLSPIDFFSDPSDLEDLDDEEILLALTQVIDNPKMWKAYKSLFDNDVASTNEVKMMRSILSQAGPLKDGDKRFENISDDKDAQSLIQTDF